MLSVISESIISGNTGLINIIWSPNELLLTMGIPSPAIFKCICGCVLGGIFTNNVLPDNVLNSNSVPTIKSKTDTV